MSINWKIEKIRELNKEVEKVEKEISVLQSGFTFNRMNSEENDYKLRKSEFQLRILQSKLDKYLKEYAKFKGYENNRRG